MRRGGSDAGLAGAGLWQRVGGVLRAAARQALSPPTRRAIRASVEGSVIAIGLRGDAVECPLCGWTGRRFARARRIHCPRCASEPRHRLLWLEAAEDIQ